MIGYLINAGARSIEPIEYEYGEMRTYLPGGLTIAQVFSNQDVLYVDDCGMLQPATVAFRIKVHLDGPPMMSNGLLTGRDSIDTTLPPAFTVEHLAAQLAWLTIDQALQWFRDHAKEPAVVSTDGEGRRTVHACWGDLLVNLEGGRGYRASEDESLMNVIAGRTAGAPPS